MLSGELVGSFGDDDPRDDIGEDSSTGAEDAEDEDEADQGDIPAVVEGEAGADPGDDARVAGAHELRVLRVGAGRLRSEGGSAGRAETGPPCDLGCAL